MDYDEARNYIKKSAEYGIVPGLANITELCNSLGNPQEDLKIIHIAGTNGKGSTGAFIEATLTDAGLKTGRLVSPAVFEYLEQFRINGRNMSGMKYAYYISRIREIADKMTPHPTPFEMETAAAFAYFRDEKCDIVLIEAGMGGGMDATNVISKSVVSVITPISMDHMRFLGNTIEDIAEAKAGIIKENGLVVSARQEKAVMAVIERKCREKNAELIVCNDEEEYEISLDGEYQRQNASLAAAVCRQLTDFGIKENNIENGLKNTVWHGRFERICDEPVFIIDGAHNIDGAKRLHESIEKYYSGRKIVYIMGVLRDKEYKKIAKITAPSAEYIYTITPDNPRGLDNAELAETVREYNRNVSAVSMDTALKCCIGRNDAVIVAFGSLSFLGELKEKADNMLRMRKCSRILRNEKYLKILSQTEEAEKDRIYCNHGINHLMDVARAAYIINLENKLDIRKELIYGAALMHDIGRYAQYTEGIHHHKAGAEIAEEILPECGFTADETKQIADAVKCHRKNSGRIKTLSDVIAAADKQTRMCMVCGAADTCKWSDDEKNMDIVI